MPHSPRSSPVHQACSCNGKRFQKNPRSFLRTTGIILLSAALFDLVHHSVAFKLVKEGSTQLRKNNCGTVCLFPPSGPLNRSVSRANVSYRHSLFIYNEKEHPSLAQPNPMTNERHHNGTQRSRRPPSTAPAGSDRSSPSPTSPRSVRSGQSGLSVLVRSAKLSLQFGPPFTVLHEKCAREQNICRGSKGRGLERSGVERSRLRVISNSES